MEAAGERFPDPEFIAADTPEVVCVTDDDFCSVGGGRVVLVIARSGVGRDPIGIAFEEGGHGRFSGKKCADADGMLFRAAAFELFYEANDMLLEFESGRKFVTDFPQDVVEIAQSFDNLFNEVFLE